MTKTILRLSIYAAIVAIIGFMIYKRLTSPDNAKAKGGPGSPKGPVAAPVSVKLVVAKTLNTKLLSTGRLVANESIELRPEISGIVEKINFTEGDNVQKGQLLVTIKSDDLKARMQKLKFSLQLAKNNEERQKKLLEREAISRQEYESALTIYQTTEAEISELKAQLDKAEIRAPFSGRIGLRQVSPGAYVSSASIIGTLVSLQPLKLDFSVPYKYADLIQKGMQVRFKIEGRREEYQANIYAIEPKIDQNSGTLLIRAMYPNSNGSLIPGTFTNVALTTKTNSSAITIPTEAIIPDVNGPKVYIVKQGLAQPIIVQTGLRDALEIEIIEGLKVGDSLIYRGVQTIKPSQPVRVIG
jgi:membrane fusion protein (multidrug efflux system)